MRLRLLRWALVGVILGVLVSAGTPTQARGAAPGSEAPTRPHAAGAPEWVSVWYRSSEGCPDGQTFVERLRALGRPGWSLSAARALSSDGKVAVGYAGCGTGATIYRIELPD